ncbi:MAG TPA: helix-turn-helix domain-containing protein, partial [Kofleriaceae bacterium]
MPKRELRADAKRNRERVLAIAQQVFAAEGLAVPIDEIAKRAGVGIGTVYRHFPTKEALFAAIVHDRMERLIEYATSLGNAAKPGDALFAVLDRLIEDGGHKKDLV